jgi:hypothetical protein
MGLNAMSKDMGVWEMPGAELIARYRSYAAKCIKISRNTSDPIGKLVLLEMAQTWLKLAEQATDAAEASPQTADWGLPQRD